MGRSFMKVEGAFLQVHWVRALASFKGRELEGAWSKDFCSNCLCLLDIMTVLVSFNWEHSRDWPGGEMSIVRA
jgi:hypothetical protein